MPSGEITITVGSSVRMFANGVLNYEALEDGRQAIAAVGYGGDEMWSIVQPHATSLQFVDHGIVTTNRSPDAGVALTYSD